MNKFSPETKIFLAIIAVTVLFVGGAAAILGKGDTGSTLADQSVLTRSDSHIQGPGEAKVTIVEFSDFECPACKAAQPALKQTINNYSNRIRFVYRQFPLPSHQYGFIAAQAAEAAGLQGKFWEMHDKLFEISPDLSKDKLIEAAKGLNLDMTKFTADLDSDQVRQKVLNDQADGNKVGISATPTFFINGTSFTGGLTIDQFKQEIDSRLK